MAYVIIGNGIAGIHAAETIRRIDPRGDITLIGDESFPPYCRPMISMVLEGAVRPDALPIRGDRFYEDLGITPILGSRVSAIDVDNRTVAVTDGKTLPFRKLLIASGADPRPIKADGLHLDNIFYMRTEAQVRAMRAALPGVKRALGLGGGLVGFKAAYGLTRQGISTTLLIRSGHPLSMQVDSTAGELVREELMNRGLDVRVGVAVTAFEGRDRVERAVLSDGTTLPCDMAIVGKGVLPALAFVPRDRIDVDLGVLVDARQETSVTGIYAAGDAAESTDIARKCRWVNAIWPEAVDQGRIAGMNMAGRAVTYPGSLSRNVIRIFDMDVMSGGVVAPEPDSIYDVVHFHDPKRRRYRKLVFREEKLVGFVLVNAIEQGGVMLSLIRRQMPIHVPRERLLAADFNWSTLFPRN